MKELLELVRIATPIKLRNVHTLSQSETIVDKLYWLLHNGKVINDEEALEHLYNGKESKVGLYQVKEKLYKKLLDSILIIDPNTKNISAYSLARHDCIKYCASLEKIAMKGGKKATIKLGDKILKIALEYNIAAVIVRVSRIMMRKSVFVLRDEKKMNYYRDLFLKYSEIEDLEELATFYWVKISLRTSQKRMIIDKQLAKEAKRYIKELESRLVLDHTALTISTINSLKIHVEELNHNHENVVELVDKHVSKLKDYKDVHLNFFTVALNNKLAALITLRKYNDAEKVAKQSLKFTREGNSAWFTSLENIIILHFYQSQYADALKVYQIATGNKGIRFLPVDRQEIFKVYWAYLQFFINLGLLKRDSGARPFKIYRSAKFLNEVPIFTKDKTGINITIIVAQFLLLFTEEKYQKAIDRIESVKQYSHAHLRKDATYRSNCFLKMLIKLVECSYHREATIRKTKVLYEKLKNHPTEMQRQTNHVEIVPFEVLWEIILDSIDNSFRGKFKRKKKI